MEDSIYQYLQYWLNRQAACVVFNYYRVVAKRNSNGTTSYILHPQYGDMLMATEHLEDIAPRIISDMCLKLDMER